MMLEVQRDAFASRCIIITNKLHQQASPALLTTFREHFCSSLISSIKLHRLSFNHAEIS
jgi:hypothetical protein